MSETPELTRHVLQGVIDLVLRDLKLGPNSVRQNGQFYVAYAAFEFACFPNGDMTKVVKDRFEILTKRYNWNGCNVNAVANRNLIWVAISKDDVKDKNRLMPL